MKLIDLLVQELPKRGGWPKGASYAVQHSHDLGLNWVIFGSGDCNLIHKSSEGCWSPEGGFCFPHEYDFKANILCDDHDTLVNREQYEVALAASKQPEWRGDGVPEKGDLCIYRDKDEGPIETIVIASYDDGGDVVIWHKPTKGRDYSVDSLCFFEAAVNAEDNKRIRVAQAMCDLLGNGITVDEKEGYGNAWLDAYDAIAAGKIPGIKLAD